MLVRSTVSLLLVIAAGAFGSLTILFGLADERVPWLVRLLVVSIWIEFLAVAANEVS